MSALILGLTFGVMLVSVIMSRISTEKAKHYLEAMNHARAAMEQYITDSTTYTLPNGDIKSLSGTCSVVASSYATNIDKVEVTVSWDEQRVGGGAGQVSVQLVTLVRN